MYGFIGVATAMTQKYRAKFVEFLIALQFSKNGDATKVRMYSGLQKSCVP